MRISRIFWFGVRAEDGGQRAEDGGSVGDGGKIREELKWIVPEYGPQITQIKRTT